jgi:hypothetical protein
VRRIRPGRGLLLGMEPGLDLVAHNCFSNNEENSEWEIGGQEMEIMGWERGGE